MTILKSHKSINLTRWIILVSILVAVLFTAACDKRDLDPNRIRVTDFVTLHEKSVLYEDNGATWIDAYVQVRDNNQFPVFGQEISFKASVEQVRFLPSRAISDSSGIARTQIFVSGRALPMGADSTNVVVGAYIGTRLQKDKTLRIKKAPDVGEIILDATVPPQVNINQNLSIKARPKDVNGNAISDGTRVTFITTNVGYFVDSMQNLIEGQIEVPVSNGFASVVWRAGTIADTTSIYAKIGSKTSNLRPTRVNAGSPRDIALSVAPEISANGVPINGPQVPVRAALSDAYGNPIAGKIINFTTNNIGNITPSMNTNTEGTCVVQFTPGSLAGSAQITAVADSAQAVLMLTVTSDMVRSLQFTNENSISLNVQGSGGIESQTVGVRLFDMSGNVVEDEKDIRFEIVSAPAGVLMDNQSITTLDKVSYGGVANVSISAGTSSGIITLRASVIGTEPLISIERANIVIHAGPPASAQILIANEDSGTSVGAGAWEVVVVAKVNDQWGNPVRKGIGVSFALESFIGFLPEFEENPPLPPTDPVFQAVSINSASYIGNVSTEGDSANGHAYTTMVYHGRLSNSTIRVKAEVGHNNVFYSDIKLPMNRIRLDMAMIPAYIEWLTPGYGNDTANPNDPASEKFSTVNIMIKDGQNVPMRHAPLLFYCTRGYFRDRNPVVFPEDEVPADFGETPNHAITDVEGLQLKRWFVKPILPPAPAPPIEGSATITVHVLGFNVSQSVEVPLRIWWSE